MRTRDDDLVALSYEVRKSPNTIYNESTHKFEPILFLLVTDVTMTDEGTEITQISVPRMVNVNGSQRVWVESNNGGEQFANTIRKKVRAEVIAFFNHSNKETRIVTNSSNVMQSVIMPVDWATRFPKFYKAMTHFLRIWRANSHDDAPDCVTQAVEKEILTGNIKPYSQMRRGIKRRN